jgi:hypothetical protein
MRFAAAPVPQPEQRSAAADFILRLAGAQNLAPVAPEARTTSEPADLPAELDQRVRLVGEW